MSRKISVETRSSMFKKCLKNQKFLREQLGEETAEAVEYALKHGKDLLRDTLTGLYSRKFMYDFWNRETARAGRNKQPLSIVVLDFDRLKEINDQYGHQIGDFFLEVLSRGAKDVMRESDIGIRWGGDEFLVILPNSDEIGAKSFVNRMKKNLIGAAKKSILVNPRAVKLCLEAKMVQFSAGVAEWDGQESFEQLFDRADERLYENKRRSL